MSVNSMRIKIAVIFVALVVSFGSAEYWVRIFYKDATVLFPRDHTDVQYGDFTIRRIRPNSHFAHSSVDGSWEFHTNKQGFRNYYDFTYDKTGKIRIVCLGDSHTQGYESDQDSTYSAVIKNRLKSDKIDVEVFNTGVSGFSTAEELVLLEHELVKYAPDFVVLGFFANDFLGNLKAGIFGLDSGGNLKVLKNEHIPGVGIQNFIYAIPGVQWLSERSYFYSMLFNSVWNFFRLRLADKSVEHIEIAVATTNEFSNYQIKLAVALIKRIYDVTKKMGAKLIIIDIPQVRGENGIKPSVIDEILPEVMQNSDHFVSNAVLNKFNKSVQFHLPNGHRHISEFTHTILGVETAKFIKSQMKNPKLNAS